METKRVSRPPRAQDFSHIPTKPFGTKPVASAPPPSAQGTPPEASHRFQFVIRQPDFEPARRAAPPDAPTRRSTQLARAKWPVSRWALFGAGLLVSLLVLVVWWAAPNDEPSGPSKAASAAPGLPADLSRPASEAGNGAPAAVAADRQKPGSTKASADTASDAEGARAAGSEQSRPNRAPNAALQRQASTRPRTTISETAAAPKKHSVLNSVLAPRPD